MLPHTRDFTRDGCTVGARLVTYAQLEEHYVCNDCGGKVIHQGRWSEEHQVSVDWAECAICKGRDFISAGHYERQFADFPNIVHNLPDELKALFAPTEPRRVLTADAAIAELYDL